MEPSRPKKEREMTRDTLSITDNRTGKSYEVPVEMGTVRALDLRQIKQGDGDFGLMAYDPAFTNTAATRSAITDVDGDVGVLLYRGYPIEQLSEHSTYLEVAYLLLHGELPASVELDEWKREIIHHTFVHENIKGLMQAFRYDAHPMGMFISTVAALSTFYPEATEVDDPANRLYQIKRLIAKVPTIAAFTYRHPPAPPPPHTRALPSVYPNNVLTFPGNFLSMMSKMPEPVYRVNPVLERPL